MKKHLIAAAALATLSTAAFAQSATVYGILDLSVSKVTNTTDTGGDTTALTDAVWMPSVIGFTGTEDLGGGLKATFNLEGDVRMDTGRSTEASSTGYTGTTKLFGRKSNVALSGNFGELKLGKDIDQIFLQGFIDNVRNAHSASAFVAHTLATDTRLDTESVFIENMVRYTTPTVGGFKASVQHKFGETAGNNSANSSTSFLVNYAAGGLSLSAGTKEMKDTVALNQEKTELTYVGATYQMGAVRLAAAHFQTKFKTTNDPDIKTSEVGVSYAVSPKLTAAVNHVMIDRGFANSDSDISSVSLKYALSKRTNVWTLVSRSNNDSNSADANGYAASRPIYNVTAANNKDSTAFSVGVTHSF